MILLNYNHLGGCQPRDSVESRLKSIGDSTHLRCLDSTACPGMKTYVFFHNNSINGEPVLVHQGSHEYTFTINTLDDAGKYCCVKKCSEDIVSISDCKCYWNIKGKIISCIIITIICYWTVHTCG